MRRAAYGQCEAQSEGSCRERLRRGDEAETLCVAGAVGVRRQAGGGSVGGGGGQGGAGGAGDGGITACPACTVSACAVVCQRVLRLQSVDGEGGGGEFGGSQAVASTHAHQLHLQLAEEVLQVEVEGAAFRGGLVGHQQVGCLKGGEGSRCSGAPRCSSVYRGGALVFSHLPFMNVSRHLRRHGEEGIRPARRLQILPVERLGGAPASAGAGECALLPAVHAAVAEGERGVCRCVGAGSVGPCLRRSAGACLWCSVASHLRRVAAQGDSCADAHGVLVRSHSVFFGAACRHQGCRHHHCRYCFYLHIFICFITSFLQSSYPASPVCSSPVVQSVVLTLMPLMALLLRVIFSTVVFPASAFMPAGVLTP